MLYREKLVASTNKPWQDFRFIIGMLHIIAMAQGEQAAKDIFYTVYCNVLNSTEQLEIFDDKDRNDHM